MVHFRAHIMKLVHRQLTAGAADGQHFHALAVLQAKDASRGCASVKYCCFFWSAQPRLEPFLHDLLSSLPAHMVQKCSMHVHMHDVQDSNSSPVPGTGGEASLSAPALVYMQSQQPACGPWLPRSAALWPGSMKMPGPAAALLQSQRQAAAQLQAAGALNSASLQPSCQIFGACMSNALCCSSRALLSRPSQSWHFSLVALMSASCQACSCRCRLCRPRQCCTPLTFLAYLGCQVSLQPCLLLHFVVRVSHILC